MTLPHTVRSASLALIVALCACAPAAAPAVESDDKAPALGATAQDEILSVKGLEGSYRHAGDGTPAVLIVPGSGPTDRDGNNPMGVRAAPFAKLADQLQSSGISSLRVDKRGMFGSAKAGDPNTVTVEIYAQDYTDWAKTLRRHTGNECVYLLGHSEGGVMVSAAALKRSDGICGVILMAAPGRPVFDILREQLRANPANAPILDQALAAIDRLEAGKSVDVETLAPPLRGMFNPAVQDFMRSAFAVDPAEQVAQLNAAGTPILSIQGDNDVQVQVEDARMHEAAGAQAIILPGVNHLMVDAPTDPAGNLATYGDADAPLADGLVPAIKSFVESRD